MFIYYFTYARVPVEVAEVAFEHRSDEWVSDIFQRASDEEDLVSIRLSAGGNLRVSKKAWMQLGAAEKVGTSTLIPIRIQGEDFPELFPTLEGEIELTPMGSELTQLTLTGNYTPPLGAVGKVIDKAVFHRIAEASIKHLLDEFAESVEKLGAKHEAADLGTGPRSTQKEVSR